MPAPLTSRSTRSIPHCRITKQRIRHASQHEDLLALSRPVQESFLAVKLLRHVFSFAIAAAVSDGSDIENGGHQSWIFNGAERPREVRRIQVLVQLNQAEGVICQFVHECQLHVATQTLCRDNLGRLWILQRHSNSNSCRNNSTAEDPSASEPACLCTSSQSSVRGSQAIDATNADILLSSPVYLVLSLQDVQVLRAVLFSTTECVHSARGRTRPRTHCRNNARTTRAPPQERLSR